MIKHKTASPTPIARRHALLRAKYRLLSSPSHTTKQLPPWTGLRDKTLWDWLSIILIPITLALYTLVMTINMTQQQTAAMEQQNTIADEQLKSQILQDYMSLTLDIDKVFIDNPDLRPYFFDGKDIVPEQKNYNKAVGIAYYHLDFFDAFIKLTSSKSFHQSQETQQVWEKYMQDSFQRSPIMCAVLKKASDDREYEIQFIDRFKGNCRKEFG